MGKPIIFNGANSKLLTKGVLLNGDGTTYARGLSIAYANSNLSAAPYTNYQVDTSSSALTITMPTGAYGVVIRFTDDKSSWATNNLTINPGSGQAFAGQAANATIVCNLSGAWIEFSWDAINSQWVYITPGYSTNNAVAVVPGVSAGYVPSAGLPGNKTGNTVAAGTLGENLSKQMFTVTATTTLTNWASVTLTPGVWLMTASAVAFTAASVGTFLQIALATASGNSIAGCTSGYDNIYAAINASQGAGQAVIPAKYVSISTSTSYYLNGRSDHTTAGDINGYLQAVRIG